MRCKTKSQDQKRRAHRDYARMRRAMESPREKELRRKLAREQAAARRAAETPEEAEIRRAHARKRRRDKAKARKRMQKRLFTEMNIQPGLCADMLECCLKVEPECYVPDYATPQSTGREAQAAEVEVKLESLDEQDKGKDACVSSLPKISNCHSVAPEESSTDAPTNASLQGDGTGVQDLVSRNTNAH